MLRPSLLLIPFVVGALASPADAHLRLTSHQARYGDDQKQGPCGRANGARTTDKVYIAKPGVQVMLVWDEFIAHPSHYRIAFDADGDDDFVDPILPCPAPQNDVDLCFETANTAPFMVNGIADTPGGGAHNYMYTLPDMECDNCTLQVIQAMQDKPPFVSPGNDIYYQCLDLVLSNDGPDTLTLMGGGEPGGPDAGPGVDPDPDPNPNEVSGGCSVGSTGGGAGAALWLLALVMLARRRRSR